MEKEGAEAMERRIDVFGGLNSPDVELLLDLLAETMGMAPAMRIMTMIIPVELVEGDEVDDQQPARLVQEEVALPGHHHD